MKAQYVLAICMFLLGCALNEPHPMVIYQHDDGGPLVPQPVFPTDCLAEDFEDEENCLPASLVVPVIQYF